ncbi:MAG TPA: hypothetical protein VKG84_10130 [Candidatus Acidoferrales bacterium]|nr:hypothetical protein [Candidatus Acidoferrales bacterium]
MRHSLGLALAIALFASVPVFAQHEEPKHEQPQHAEKNPPRANGGHIPPPPPARTDPKAARETEKFQDGRASDRPHVNNDHWYGHEPANDARFHVDHPFPHGRFAHFGPTYRYNVLRVDVNAHRFWLPGGFFFEVAPWDWEQCAGWCWNCGNDFVVYEDSDHAGWYLLYNVHTGVYIHVQYLGS